MAPKYARPAAPIPAEFPNGRNDKEWLKHTLFSPVDNSICYKPVNLQPLTVEPVALHDGGALTATLTF